ncbi:hypothetical protein AWZ03_012434 [Drosophila navojoa]|uniref:Uncharacterized protein n=1 Tax=Drosophila navojoa TaxID=7232 RepID=A0A484AXK0_DRONA|nr:hypothetical protein AWZ03_012434 [Drosophila navojoa]
MSQDIECPGPKLRPKQKELSPSRCADGSKCVNFSFIPAAAAFNGSNEAAKTWVERSTKGASGGSETHQLVRNFEQR